MLRMNRGQRWFLAVGCTSSVLVFIGGLLIAGRRTVSSTAPPPESPPRREVPWREPPERFARDTHLPPIAERKVSGSNDPATFDPTRDLVRVEDARAWWESDHDKGDTEDDHVVHRHLKIPLRRLIDEVHARNGILEIHDTYRPSGIHNSRSLHQEGRAIDVTCDEMARGELAKLCWKVGFDWVYYEYRKGNGAHIHCSVRRD